MNTETAVRVACLVAAAALLAAATLVALGVPLIGGL